jgi:hypothetical protein
VQVPPPPIKQRVPAGLAGQPAPADGQSGPATQQQRQVYGLEAHLGPLQVLLSEGGGLVSDLNHCCTSDAHEQQTLADILRLGLQMMLAAQPSGNLPPGVAPQPVQRLPSATSVPMPAQLPPTPANAQPHQQQQPAPGQQQQPAAPLQQPASQQQQSAAGQPVQAAAQPAAQPAAPAAGQPQVHDACRPANGSRAKRQTC